MKVNNEAIYGTRAIDPYKEGKVCLTKKRMEQFMPFIWLKKMKQECHLKYGCPQFVLIKRRMLHCLELITLKMGKSWKWLCC